jgi:hypothetical protein
VEGLSRLVMVVSGLLTIAYRVQLAYSHGSPLLQGTDIPMARTRDGLRDERLVACCGQQPRRPHGVPR